MKIGDFRELELWFRRPCQQRVIAFRRRVLYVFYGTFLREAAINTPAQPELEPGRAYRTRDLRPWSANPTRLARRLVAEGKLHEVAHGIFYAPRPTRFGPPPRPTRSSSASFSAATGSS